MPTVFEKLNFKQQREIVVLDAPDSFAPETDALVGVNVRRKLASGGNNEFVLAFVTAQSAIDGLVPQIAQHAPGDVILWFAYPKGTSRRYQCDFNRDTGWDAVRAAGFDSVRQIAIDADWTALRFRRIEFIKNSIRR